MPGNGPKYMSRTTLRFVLGLGWSIHEKIHDKKKKKIKLVVELVPSVPPRLGNPTSSPALKSPILCLLQLIPAAVPPLSQAWKCQAVLGCLPSWRHILPIWGPESRLRTGNLGWASDMRLWRRTVKPNVFCPGQKKNCKNEKQIKWHFPQPRLLNWLQGTTDFVAMQYSTNCNV